MQVTQNGALTALLMKQLVFANNALQQQLLEELNSGITPGSGQEVSIYDTYTYFESLLLDPPESAYGSQLNITGFSSTCCQIAPSADCTACPSPQAFFYFDRRSASRYRVQRP